MNFWGNKMRRIITFILTFCIFAPSAHCEVPLLFRARVQLLDKPTTDNLIKTLDARINYLENRDYLHELYVQGVPASQDKAAVTKALKAIIDISRQIDIKVSLEHGLSDKCALYFADSARGYQSIISATQEILSQENLGSQSAVGHVFRQIGSSLIANTHAAISPAVARATIQFELLSYPLKEHNILFLNNMELPASLIKKDVSICNIESREELQQLFAERLSTFEQLHLLVLGQRGVWDVAVLSNLLVNEAQTEISEIRTELFMFEATAVFTLLAWPYVSVYIAGLEYGAQIRNVLTATNLLVTLYLGAKTGYAFYNSEVSPAGTLNTHQAIEQQIDQTLHLPKTALELYRLVSSYELQWHLYNLKLSPEKNVAGWYPEALRSFGTDEGVLASYKEKLQYLKANQH
jgi:hypothetical protein